jgi:transposase
MTTMADPTTCVTVGVDTHRDINVAVALDELGRRLGVFEAPTTTAGYRALVGWARRFGPLGAFGVEGTNSYGAGLARFLAGEQVQVVEVCRPNRLTRRHHGKSDPVDAEAAARAVLAGVASAVPKAGTGAVEMIRSLRLVRAGAIKARTQAINTVRGLLVTAPAELRDQLHGLRTADLMRRSARLRPGTCTTPTAAVKLALRSLGQRWQQLNDEIALLDEHLEALVAEAAPAMVATFGISTDTAGAVLVAAGDNPERLHSEAAFAMLCGVAPRDASSGLQRRHRLNRAGNRQANAALYRTVIVRMRWHAPTRAYVERRTKEGKTKREIIRSLKRYLARELYQTLPRTT